MRKLCCLSIFIAAVAVCGCKEKENPLIEKGEALYNEQKWEEAEKAFKDALAEGPELAKAHLGLARIYQENQTLLAHAIYHYDRFLELDPEAESAGMFVRERQAVEEMLIKNVIESSPEVTRIRNSAQAQESAWGREKTQLQNQIARLEEQLRAARTTQGPTTPPRGSQGSTTPPRGSQGSTTPSRTSQGTTSNEPIIYTVAKQDTLSKIANRFYRDTSKWTIIYEANKDTLPDPNSLKVGQSLVIPQLEE
ncbi:MAG: LysM peptidoglycan-binding domain-containing protein [Pontiellaceae bacterium]|nr:LysM peptidoglycan-binding domain-containing protein [Pontiellaceae bacterium]